ncbi:plastidial pyruvate kinase 4, chloroplastic [Tanacetum coccineum]
MASDGSDQDTRYALSNLLQMGTVAEYESEFVTGVLHIDLLHWQDPKNLGEAFALARINEARFEDERATTIIAKPNDLNIAVQVQDIEKTTLHTSDKVEAMSTNPGTETTPATVRARTYTDLTDEEKLRESVDITETNIVLQGLPQDIYNFVNHNEDAKQIWDRVKLLIQGSELSLQERESKMYDDFDTSAQRQTTIPIGMSMKPLQVNTKFVNHLQPEWSKFVTNTTNFDHLYAHLRQHEAHANEVRLERQRLDLSAAYSRHVLSAANLIHYLALRSLDVDQIKEDLSSVGLLNMETINPHVIASLSVGIQMLENLKSNSLDGDEIDKRSHIMVTVGEEAAANETFIHDDLRKGAIIIQLDLAGPKLRTGRMKEGPCVMKISPKRNIYGNVINPAQVWVAQKGAGPPPAHVSPDAVIYVDGQEFLKNLAVGDAVRFSDARGKQRFLKISKKFPVFTGVGFMANCTKTCYV